MQMEWIKLAKIKNNLKIKMRNGWMQKMRRIEYNRENNRIVFIIN